MFAISTILVALPGIGPPESNQVVSARDALQPFNVLVGTWRGTGTPEGVSRDQRAAGMWTETIQWSWQFKGDDAWLEVSVEKGKLIKRGELRWISNTSQYQLTLTSPDQITTTYLGTLKDKVLTLDRVGNPASEEQRIVLSLLHYNRHLYRFETRPTGSMLGFEKKYQIGATKEGVPFADVPRGPECIVSGGAGTIRVTYNGKEYYVCCSGCRDEFKADPEKYIKEAEAKAKGKK